MAARLLLLAPRALRDALSKDGEIVSRLPPDFPRELLAAKTRGMLHGPAAYLRARRRVRQLSDAR